MLKTLLLQPLGVGSSFKTARKATLPRILVLQPEPWVHWWSQTPAPALVIFDPGSSKRTVSFDNKVEVRLKLKGKRNLGGWVGLTSKKNEFRDQHCQMSNKRTRLYIYTYYVSYIYIYDTTARQPPAPKHRNPTPGFFTLPMGRKVNLESEHPMTLRRRVLMRMRRMGIIGFQSHRIHVCSIW